jgi:hypothetical protein
VHVVLGLGPLVVVATREKEEEEEEMVATTEGSITYCGENMAGRIT